MIGKYKYSSVFDCAKKSYKNEGIKVFSRGLMPTILRFVNYFAIYKPYSFLYVLEPILQMQQHLQLFH